VVRRVAIERAMKFRVEKETRDTGSLSTFSKEHFQNVTGTHVSLTALQGCSESASTRIVLLVTVS
jgi:hypothetical protein